MDRMVLDRRGEPPSPAIPTVSEEAATNSGLTSHTQCIRSITDRIDKPQKAAATYLSQFQVQEPSYQMQFEMLVVGLGYTVHVHEWPLFSTQIAQRVVERHPQKRRSRVDDSHSKSESQLQSDPVGVETSKRSRSKTFHTAFRPIFPHRPASRREPPQIGRSDPSVRTRTPLRRSGQPQLPAHHSIAAQAAFTLFANTIRTRRCDADVDRCKQKTYRAAEPVHK